VSSDEAAVGDGPALGSDPFLQSDGTLPYLLRLREASMRMVTEARSQPQEREHVLPSEPPDLGPPIPELPTFDDRDESAGALDRLAGWLLTRSDDDRLAQLFARLDGRPYDEFGMSPRVARRALAFFKLLYKYWFRVESSGRNDPRKEGAILAANHGGCCRSTPRWSSPMASSRRTRRA
jgi:hypothetical protein